MPEAKFRSATRTLIVSKKTEHCKNVSNAPNVFDWNSNALVHTAEQRNTEAAHQEEDIYENYNETIQSDAYKKSGKEKIKNKEQRKNIQNSKNQNKEHEAKDKSQESTTNTNLSVNTSRRFNMYPEIC